MVNDNYTHDDVPKCRVKYAYTQIDLLSLKRQNWNIPAYDCLQRLQFKPQK